MHEKYGVWDMFFLAFFSVQAKIFFFGRGLGVVVDKNGFKMNRPACARTTGRVFNYMNALAFPSVFPLYHECWNSFVCGLSMVPRLLCAIFSGPIGASVVSRLFDSPDTCSRAKFRQTNVCTGT